MASEFCRRSDCKQGLYIQISQPTVLQAIGCHTGGFDWRKISRYNSAKHTRAGREKRKNGHRWLDRLLSFAEAVRVQYRSQSKRGIIGNASPTFPRGGISIFCIEDYVGRERGIAYGAQRRNFKIGTILPDTNREGVGFFNKILDANYYSGGSGNRCN